MEEQHEIRIISSRAAHFMWEAAGHDHTGIPAPSITERKEHVGQDRTNIYSSVAWLHNESQKKCDWLSSLCMCTWLSIPLWSSQHLAAHLDRRALFMVPDRSERRSESQALENGALQGYLLKCVLSAQGCLHIGEESHEGSYFLKLCFNQTVVLCWWISVVQC